MSIFEFTIFPEALFYFTSFDINLFSPSIFGIVFPMPDVIITVHVYLPSKAISLLVIFTLTFVDMRIGLRENLSANALDLPGFGVQLAINLCSVFVYGFSIRVRGVDLISRILDYIDQSQGTQHMPSLSHDILNIILFREIDFISRFDLQHLDDFGWELLLKSSLFEPVILDAPEV